MTLFFGISCAILLVLLVGSVFFNVKLFRAGMKQLERAEEYEHFYDETCEIVGSFYDQLDMLVNRRQMVSDDPDVQAVHKTVGVLHDFLLGWLNAKRSEGIKEKSKKEE